MLPIKCKELHYCRKWRMEGDRINISMQKLSVTSVAMRIAVSTENEEQLGSGLIPKFQAV